MPVEAATIGRRLDDQVVVVVGASRGTGKVVAERLVDVGASVVMIARDLDRLKEVAAELDDRAHPIAADISDPDSVRSAFAEIDTMHGRVDGLVNSAVVGWPHRIEEVSDEQLMTEVGTNLVGPILTCRASIPLMRRAGGGTIVNVSSESVLDPFPSLAVYAATKAGLENLSLGLAREVKRDGIRVTVLRSGFTAGGEFSAHWDRDAEERIQAEWKADGYLARIAGSEPQSPERIAEAVIFVLTSPMDSMVDVISVRART